MRRPRTVIRGHIQVCDNSSCGKEFTTSTNQIYCQPSCRLNKKPLPKKCKRDGCETIFTSKRGVGKYCSRSCYLLVNRAINAIIHREDMANGRYGDWIGYWNTTASAKKRGIDCDLTVEQWREIRRLGECIYCQSDLPVRGGGVDRVNSYLGYTASNLVACCQTCNSIRGKDLISHEEMFHVVKLLKELRLKKFLEEAA